MDPNAVANQAISGSAKEQMAREVSVMLSANTGPYQQEMKHAAEQTNKLVDAIVKVEKAYQGTLKFIGKSAMGMGASMQAAAAGAVWSAAQFEESFARVAKTTGLENQSVIVPGHTGRMQDFAASLGLGDNALQEFQNDIRGLSTEIPVSVQELSYLADIAGTLGVESDNLVLFADTAAKLGAAINDLGSDQAIAGLANLIGAFGRAEEEVTNLGSSLADLANHTRGNASEILQFSDRLAGTAVQVGMTAEEVMGLGAAVSAIGARPELGASAIVQAMNTISIAVQSSGSELDNFARAMGMASEDLEAMWSDQGATAVLTRLLSSLNEQGEEAVMTLRALGLSGVGTTQILGGLAAQLGTYNEAMEISIDASKKGSAVAELAAVRFDTVYKSMQRFGQTTAEVFRSLGVGFLAPFKALIDLGTGLVNLFNKIPAPLRALLGLLVGLGGAVLVAAGAFTIFFAAFHGLFAIIYVAPKLVNLLTIAVAKMGAGSEAAVRQLSLLSDRLRRFSEFIQAAPQHVKNLFRSFQEVGVLKTFGRGLDAAKAKLRALWEAPRLAGARESISEVYNKIWPRITAGTKGAREAIKGLSKELRDTLRDAFDSVGTSVANFRKQLGGMYRDGLLQMGIFASQKKKIWSELLASSRTTFANLREGLAQTFRGMMAGGDGEANMFGRLISSARTGMKGFVSTIAESSKDAREALVTAFRGGWPEVLKLARETAVRMGEALVRGLKRVGSAIATALPNLMTYAGVLGSEFIDRLRTSLDGGGPRLLAWAKRTAGDLGAAFQLGIEELGKRVRQRYARMIESLGEVMRDTLPRLAGRMKTSWARISESISEALADVRPRLVEWARNTTAGIGTALVLGFESMKGRIKSAYARVANAAFDAWVELSPRLREATRAVFDGFGKRSTEAFRAFVSSARPVVRVAGEIFATLVERGAEGFARLIPGIKRLGKELGVHLVKGLERVGRAARWVFREFFVKETLEIMKVALVSLGKAASLAAKPFIALGKHIAGSITKNAIGSVESLRASMKLLATDGSAAALGRAFTMLSVQADALKRNVALSFPTLTAALVAAKAHAIALGTVLTTALGPGLAAALIGAKTRTVALGSALTTALGPAVAAMVSSLKTQFALLGLSIKMMLGPIGWIIAGFAAITGALWAWGAVRSRNDEVVDSFFAVAAAAGLVTDEIERMSWATANVGLEDLDLASSGRNVVSRLRSASDENADDISFSYAASLVRSGHEPEQVLEHINQLRRLAGLGPIEFEYTFRQLSSGDPFEEWLESTQSTVQGLFTEQLAEDSFDGVWENVWAIFGKTPDKLKQAFNDTLQQMKDVGDSNLPAMIALIHDMEASIDAAVASGQVGTDIGEALRGQMYDDLQNSLPEMHEPNAWAGGLAWTLDTFLNPFIPNDSAIRDWMRKNSTGFGNQQSWIAELVGNEDNHSLEDVDHIIQAVKDITGETQDLDKAVRDLDSEGFADLQREIAKAAREIQDSKMVETLSTITTQLGRKLFEGQMSVDPENYKKYEQHVLETYHHQVGHVRALEEMNIELDKAVHKHGQWDERTEAIASAMKKVREEYAQVKLNELQLELQDTAPTQQLAFISQKLRELTDDPWNIDVRIQYEEQFRQTYQQQVQNFRQTMQQYDQLIDRREETVRSHNENLEKMEENHQRQMTRGREDHDRRLGKMEEGRLKSVENANKQYKKRLEDIEKAEKKALENRVEQQARAFGLIERIQATPTADLGAMLDNMRAQNAAMGEMTQGLSQLRSMGINEDILEALGLNDPRNFAQVRRMVEMAVSDPGMIDAINREWATRLDLSEAFVKEADTSAIKEQFDEQRSAAKEALDEQVKDINERHREQLKETNENFARAVDDANENYGRQIEQANENHQKQLENIAESLAKLGEDTFETLNELIEKALNSTLDNLIAAATAIERWELEYLGRAPRTPEALTADEVDIRYGITPRAESDAYDDFFGLGQKSADGIRVGFRNGVPVTWRELRAEIASGTSSGMDVMAGEITGGVTRSHRELNRISDQDSIWNTARASGETGARRLSDGISIELERGTGRINSIMEQWGFGITSHLNPVLEAIGENPINVSVRRVGGGGPAQVRAADGALLPDQAKIQRPGTLVQWAEPETGGEAFIPLASSKRQRSLAIWEETGRRLGAEFADGGFLDLPDFSALGDIGDATSKAVSHTNDKVDEFLSSLGYGVDGSDGVFRPRSGQYGGVQPWVAWSGNVVNAIFGPLPGGIGGVGSRSGPSDHPTGHALDFMVGDTSSGHALGDRISRFLLSNWADHAMKYLIWKQRITSGGAWKDMAGRGSRTADHWDHPHVSYNARPGPNYDGPATPVNLALPKVAREATPPPGISEEGQRPRGTSPGTAFTAMANGGIDNIPAWMTEGEFVMSKDAHTHYGTDMMEALNAKRFANGGAVGNFSRNRGREPMGGGSQTDLVNALSKALANASMGSSETNNWDVKVEAKDTKGMIRELEAKKRLSRLTRSGQDG